MPCDAKEQRLPVPSRPALSNLASGSECFYLSGCPNVLDEHPVCTGWSLPKGEQVGPLSLMREKQGSQGEPCHPTRGYNTTLVPVTVINTSGDLLKRRNVSFGPLVYG